MKLTDEMRAALAEQMRKSSLPDVIFLAGYRLGLEHMRERGLQCCMDAAIAARTNVNQACRRLNEQVADRIAAAIRSLPIEDEHERS